MFYLILFFLEVYLLFKLEQKQWKTLITPLNVMALTFSFALITIILYCSYDKDTPPFYYPSLILWMFGLLIFEIASAFISWSSVKLQKSRIFNIEISKNDDKYHLLRNFAFFCIAVSFIRLRSLSSIEGFGTDEFSEDYQVTGVFAHLAVILSCIFAYAIYKLDFKHRSSLLIIAGALVGMYAVGTKSWIIAPFLMGYLARLMTGRTKLSIKTTVVPVLIVFGIFFLSYFLILVIATESDVTEDFVSFVFTHFVDYLGGPVLAFSLDFKKGFVEPDMTEALFAPFINFVHAFTKEKYINVINPVFLDLGTLGDNNVRTFFGTIYAYSKNPFVFLFVTLLFSTVINYVYCLSRRSRSVFLLLANCSNMVFLMFGFFDFYWLSLTPYEVTILFILMHVLLYKKDMICLKTPKN